MVTEKSNITEIIDGNSEVQNIKKKNHRKEGVKVTMNEREGKGKRAMSIKQRR